MAEWTHNLCERCWFTNRKYSAHESGGFRQPTRVNDQNDICCLCGVPTVSGIYVRANQSEMLCKGDHEHPDKWSPLLGEPVPATATVTRDDDYTPEAIDRTQDQSPGSQFRV
jgi:hypothetical protein